MKPADLARTHRSGLRRSLACATVSLMLLIPVGSVGATPARQERNVAAGLCPPIGSRTMAADAQAQVYETGPPVPNPNTLQFPSAKTLYSGCVLGRRSFSAGFGPLVGPLALLTISGRYAAYMNVRGKEEAGGSAAYSIAVWNLLSGTTRLFAPCSDTDPTAQYQGGGFATNLVINSVGTTAWICFAYHDPQSGQPSPYEVHLATAAGPSELVASSTTIDPTSLAMSAHRLYWTQGGQPQSTPLP